MSGIIHESIRAFKAVIVPRFLTFPHSVEEQQDIMTGMQGFCGLPHCMGAMDGTFMKILKPSKNGDCYFCYKKFYGIVLLGVCDHHMRIYWVDAGRAGKKGDASVWNSSVFKDLLLKGEILDADARQVGEELVKPYIVADAAFALSDRIMKCYDNPTPGAENDFNASVIRTRRIIENAWGRLIGKWRIIHRNQLYDPEKASDVAMICIALHNFLIEEEQLYSKELFGKIPKLPPRKTERASRATRGLAAAHSVRRSLTVVANRWWIRKRKK